MNRQEFLELLRQGLCGLPSKEAAERVAFYGEMIDDRMEEGLSEEAAVAEMGEMQDLISQSIADVPLAKLVKDKMTRKRQMKAWEIALLVLGSPIWLSLLIAVTAVLFSLYVAVWSAIVSLWAIFVSFAACAVGGLAAGVVFGVGGHVLTGIAVAGVSIASLGFAILTFRGCKAATKGILLLTKKIAVHLKHRCVGKGEV